MTQPAISVRQVTKSYASGQVLAGGHDVITDYRAARNLIGLVPQELKTDAFETVQATTAFSRGLFGKPANPAFIEKILRDLSLLILVEDKTTLMNKLGKAELRVTLRERVAEIPEALAAWKLGLPKTTASAA
eukprot:gene10904-10986_t